MAIFHYDYGLVLGADRLPLAGGVGTFRAPGENGPGAVVQVLDTTNNALSGIVASQYGTFSQFNVDGYDRGYVDFGAGIILPVVSFEAQNSRDLAQQALDAAAAAAATAEQALDAASSASGTPGSGPSAINDATSTSTTAPLTAAATKAAIQTKIDTLVGGAPAALDSFYEIASQLSSDESAVAVLNTSVAGKVGKTGTETIAGAKTFSSPVTVATPTAPTHAATMAYVDTAVANAGGGSGGSSGIAYDTDGVPYVASTGAGTGMAVDTDGSYYIS